MSEPKEEESIKKAFIEALSLGIGFGVTAAVALILIFTSLFIIALIYNHLFK